ncbi:hypothetical protein BDW68DRAFT_179914 [Aspergillus falconensis]
MPRRTDCAPAVCGDGIGGAVDADLHASLCICDCMANDNSNPALLLSGMHDSLGIEMSGEKDMMEMVGSAAHRVPPWGALGLNTGFQDVQNLVWKLVYAIKELQIGNNKQPGNLLDTYGTERRPITLRVAAAALSNLRNHALAMDRALGIHPTQSAEESMASLNAYFNPIHPSHMVLRQSILDAQKVLGSEFHVPSAEIGCFYESDIDNDNDHGRQIAEDGLVLFAMEPGWLALEEELDEVHVKILDGNHGNWEDKDGAWPKTAGYGDEALLVRPDGIMAVGWTAGWQTKRGRSIFQRSA